MLIRRIISHQMTDFPHLQTQYELLHEVGISSSSDVYMARCVTNNRLVALKMINLDSAADFASLRTGTSVWSTTNHPNLLSYYGSFLNGSSLWVIFEYMDCGSCDDVLKFDNPNGFKDERLIATILKNVLNFLVYFHKTKGIHRNLKSEYIFVSTNGEVKVGGLWAAGNLIKRGIRKSATFSRVGISDYTAPEILTGNGYTEKVDIWSLGMIAIELACGKTLFNGITEMEQMQRLMKWSFEVPEAMNNISKDFQDFLRCCLKSDPTKRPTAAELMKHSFIRQAMDHRYIATAMSGVVPLAQRFGRKSKVASFQIKQVRDPVVFDFGDNYRSVSEDESLPETPTKVHMEVVKKGRFTLRMPVHSPIDGAKPLSKKAKSYFGLDRVLTDVTSASADE